MTKLLACAPERLHHHAYVVKDQERNRQFFEDVLGDSAYRHMVRAACQPLGQS
jgi:hypothetical protein